VNEAARRLETVLEHVQRENTHDLQGIMNTFGPSARYDDAPWEDHRLGRSAVQKYYEELLTALPDLQILIEHEMATDDEVVLEARISGTHSGTWRGLPPTGRRVDFPLCGVFSFDSDGKLAGERIYYDRGNVLQQIGLYRDPRSFLGGIEAFLAHPITILRAFFKKLFSSKKSGGGPQAGQNLRTSSRWFRRAA
jgi:steroid delta-isomerase-like uncharacterized protein